MTLTVGSLFSGIGGLDLGLERAGMKVIWQSEIDPYCNKVLKKHWPEVTNHGNIKEIDWRTVERPDVICGGYPCQPFSTAGKRRGTDDPRHLWPWVRDAISALRPTYAILENVRGHLSMGGLQVIGELAKIGYDAEWRVVSAAGVGAPHRRDRIIIVAYANGTRGRTSRSGIDRNGSQEIKEQQNISQSGPGGCSEDVADSASQCSDGRQPRGNKTQSRKEGLQEQIRASSSTLANTNSEQLGERRVTKDFRSQDCIWGNHRGRKAPYDGWQWWQVEPDVGRVADGVSSRVDRLRGLGNAVVPQVAEYIGRLVIAAHNNT